MTKEIPKPWGKELWLETEPEYELIMKKLHMKKGCSCSLQYHEKKFENFYVLSGQLKLTIGKTLDTLEEKMLFPGDHYTIQPMVIHRMTGVEDSVYIESSTNHLDDVVRLQDDYDRK